MGRHNGTGSVRTFISGKCSHSLAEREGCSAEAIYGADVPVDGSSFDSFTIEAIAMLA